MNFSVSPVGIAQIVARNITPLVGIILFHWDATNVVLLYFLDTMLSMAVIFAGLAKSFMPGKDDGIAARIKTEVSHIVSALIVATFMAIPLSLPIVVVVASSDFSFRFALGDESLRFGMLFQCVMAFWSYVDLYRALDTHSPEQLMLKRRFGLVLMRWVVVVGVCYLALEVLPANFVVYALVAAYIGASIFAEIAPDRFLRATPGAEYADDSPGGSAIGKPGSANTRTDADRKDRKPLP